MSLLTKDTDSLPDQVVFVRYALFKSSNGRVLLKILNAALFQLTWFGCVLGGARGEWWWGAVGVTALVLYSRWQTTLARDLRFVVALVAVGFVLDSLWATSGVLDFGGEAHSVALAGFELRVAPVWILLLWSGVGLTLMHSLGVFVPRPWLGAIMAGGASVPSYLAGERLGGVIIPEPYALGIIICVWATLFFLMFRWARTLLPSEPSELMEHSSADSKQNQI